jgi:hypothetical protein
MVPPADNPAHLSVHSAFVVQFQVDTAVEQGRLVRRQTFSRWTRCWRSSPRCSTRSVIAPPTTMCEGSIRWLRPAHPSAPTSCALASRR